MNLNIGKELAALRRMSVGELRARYAEVFDDTTNTCHNEWLIKRIIYRMQVLAEGEVYKSLSAVAKTITGSHTSGYLFFRLTKKGGDQ